MLGKHHTKESINKISLAHKGKKLSNITINKIKKAKQDISLETRQKMSLAKRGKPGRIQTEKEKLKRSNSVSGIKNQAYGKKWWTDGNIVIFAKNSPGDTFILGRKFK